MRECKCLECGGSVTEIVRNNLQNAAERKSIAMILLKNKHSCPFGQCVPGTDVDWIEVHEYLGVEVWEAITSLKI